MKESKFYPIKGYYTERNRGKCVEYEDNYWDVVTDPDGTIRNRADERERKLNDLKSEQSHFNGLPGSNFLDVGCWMWSRFCAIGIRRGMESLWLRVFGICGEVGV